MDNMNMSNTHSLDNSMESMYANNHVYEDDRSLGSRSMDISTSNIGMPPVNQDQFAGDGGEDGGGLSIIGSVETDPEGNHHHNHHHNHGNENENQDQDQDANHAENENSATAEAEIAVTKERQMLYKENQQRLHNILLSMKNSTQTILSEMSTYLKETEEIEKTYIRCRANTQKETQRLESVEPDVMGATAQFGQGQPGMFAAGRFM